VVSELETYTQLVSRIDATELQTRELANEAYKKGDQETVWVCKTTLAGLDRERARMRPPDYCRSCGRDATIGRQCEHCGDPNPLAVRELGLEERA